jgi:putative SOS response-associated peptidase YedK
MCGRYFFDASRNTYFQMLLKQAEGYLTSKDLENFRRGEIAPGEKAFIVTYDAARRKYHTQTAQWGYALASGKKLVINARSETADASVFFAASVRCLVLASGYYEWEKNTHQRFLFDTEAETIGLGGLAERDAQSRLRFVILTQPASAEASRVHDRMPLLYEHEEAARFFQASSIAQAASYSRQERRSTPG